MDAARIATRHWQSVGEMGGGSTEGIGGERKGKGVERTKEGNTREYGSSALPFSLPPPPPVALCAAATGMR